MTRTHARALTSGPEWKCILLFALPIMLGQFLQQLYSTVDGIVVGNYVSSGALAAVGNCGIMANLFLAVSLGMSNGSAVLVSQLFGAGRREDMRRAAATSLTLLAALGAAAGLSVRELRCGEAAPDARLGMFVLRGAADCAALLVDESGDDGDGKTFTDFVLKGELKR